MISEIAQVMTAAAAFAAVVVSIINLRKISEIHIIINSRMTELLRETQTNAKAAGVKEERDRAANYD